MSSYVQHQYELNDPWSLNSYATDFSDQLDGDEELLVLDNSRLDFNMDSSEPDYCLCNNCSNNDRSNCLNSDNNTSISVISGGNVVDEVNNWANSSANHTLEPSDSVFPNFTQTDAHNSQQSGDYIGHSLSISDNGLNGHRRHSSAHIRDHNWLTHCHPNQLNSRSQATRRANRQLIIGCVLCLVFMLAEFVGGFLSNSLAIMTGNQINIFLSIISNQF